MALLNFRKRQDPFLSVDPEIAACLRGFSIEVMPRTAAKIDSFGDMLPQGTRVYIAHISGTPIAEMVATAARLRAEGFEPMPHFPARIIADLATLNDWVDRYQGEAGVTQGLILAGGDASAVGDFHCSMDLLETGVFDRAGFTRLHVAGHPEGNRDIDPDGGDAAVMDALRWKQAFNERSDAKMALATQFCFDSKSVLAWAARLQAENIDLPIHLGVAGPAKLQTLIRFAIACGVGPSLKVLQKRAMDVTKLLLPYEPGEMIADLARHQATHPDSNIEAVHFFPLGGIKANATWVSEQGGAAADPSLERD